MGSDKRFVSIRITNVNTLYFGLKKYYLFITIYSRLSDISNDTIGIG